MSEIIINKSNVLAEVAKGGTALEVAQRMGIKLPMLRQAAKAFNINLRSKPTVALKFVDDTIEPTAKAPIKDAISFTNDTEL